MGLVIKYDPKNPQGFAQAVLAAIFLCLSWPTVIARLAARYSIKSLGKDDWLAVIAQICYSVFCIAIIGFHSAVPGFDATSWDRRELAINYLIANETSFAASVMFLKLSLGAFFLRIVVSKPQRQVIYVAVAISTVFNIYLFLMAIFACGDPSKFLVRYITNRCVPRSVLRFSGFTQAAISTATDLIFATIPFFLLRNSRLPMQVKLYVGGLLLLATLGCVASIVRFWYTNSLFELKNFYTRVPALFIVGLVEIGTGIMASSLTTIRPLLKSCAGLKSTIRSNGQNRTKSSKRQKIDDLEDPSQSPESNELQEVTYHDHKVKRGSTESEEVLWTPGTTKEEGVVTVVATQETVDSKAEEHEAQPPT